MFWLNNPVFNQLDFNMKLSNINVNLIENDFQINLKDFPGKFY